MKSTIKRSFSLLLCLCIFSTAACSVKTPDSNSVLPTVSAAENTSVTPSDDSSRTLNNGPFTTYDAEHADYRLSIDAADEVHGISDMLYGIFLEDINFAADGGLYAEMVQNRSFEFTSLAANNELHGWSIINNAAVRVVRDDKAGRLNDNNPNYVIITNDTDSPAGISNTGFLDGMAVHAGESYNCTFYARALDGYTGDIYVSLTVNGEPAVSVTVASSGPSVGWVKYSVKLISPVTADKKVRLAVEIGKGSVAFDMISLFPEDTYKGRVNGLRKDLAEALEELHPAFLRFPGGCVIEGVTLPLAYSWKASIGADDNGEPFLFNGTYGDVAARRQGQNIWTNENTTNDRYPSFMSYGLGFYEYFLLAEDIGAVGVPVINCGLCCMGQGNGSGPMVGTPEFERYIQDALDLVEFAKGGTDTKWGAVRASMGHPEPFRLKYIGIGNEQYGTEFFRHYEAFVDAFAAAAAEDPGLYGDVELMFSAGLDDGDSGAAQYMASYREASRWLTAHPGTEVTDFAGAIDHHYYNSPEWFLSHTDYYDPVNYSRTTDDMTSGRFGGAVPVFVGEYAARSNTWRAALAEAAYMTGLERNGDIVRMAAYAPLFGNLTATHWAPDLIWFNNHTMTRSVNYYVQQLFSLNAGTVLLSHRLEGAEPETPSVFTGKIGVGTWNTSARFDNIVVTDNKTGEVLYSDTFDKAMGSNWERVSDGRWSVSDGTLIQSSNSTDTGRYSSTGTAAYCGDTSWSDYTLTLEATKIAGSEGFLIPFAVQDRANNWFWNIGGWNNTVSCLQQVTGGSKSDQIGGTVSSCTIKAGQTYRIQITVSGSNVKCRLNDRLYIDYDMIPTTNAESYTVVSTDDTGDVIIKLVNVTGESRCFAIDIAGIGAAGATLEGQADITVYQAAGTSPENDNILGKAEDVKLDVFMIPCDAKALASHQDTGYSFNCTVPKYSVTALRIPRSR